ncbi:hypothetical protein HD806DRAFT_527232 [Xylariaceae sp. AK1471]|nr:hypothetical protein HD806DRAFT_527232 [Xylariaceae sp. AK1471]
MPAIAYPTNNPLIDGIAIWAGNNAFKLLQLYSVKGGWEGWAEAELCLLMPQWIGGSCSREDREVYTNNDLADLLHENTMNNTKNIIELKCQSLYQDDTNMAGFRNVYSVDAGKIQAGNRHER